MTNEQATREWIAHMVSATLVNWGEHYDRLRGTVIDTLDRETYEQALRAGDTSEFARVAGDLLGDEVADIVAEEISSDSLSYRLLMDLLDTGDRAQWALIADSFMPELSDLDDIDWN